MSEPASNTKVNTGEKKPRPESAATDKKPRPESAAGDRKPRGGGGGRGGARGGGNRGQPRQDNGAPIEEEHKEGEERAERKKREGANNKEIRKNRRENNRKGFLTKEQITIETEIPPLPKKSERFVQPDEAKFKADIEEIDRQIDQLHQKRRDYLTDINKTIKENKGKKSNIPLLDIIQAKRKEKNEIYDRLKVNREAKDNAQKLMEQCYDEQQKYRQKMKKVMSEDEIKKELKALQDLQSKGTVANLQEEKRIINEISALERSLPFAGPLSELNKKYDELKAERKKAVEALSVSIKEAERVKKELDDLNEDYTKIKQEHTENSKSLEPVVEGKKQEFQNKIEELKEKKNKMYKDYRESWDKYEDQQEFIKYVEWVTKVKTRLIRAEERRKEEEEFKKQEQDQKKDEQTFHPFQAEIETCNLLIAYCNKLSGRKEGESVKADERPQNVEKSLESVEWKKEKIEVVKGKKDVDNDFFAPKKAPKKNVQGEKASAQATSLNHQIEIIGFFENVKVPPPLSTSKLDETIKQLQEKREYFNNLKADESKPEDQKAKEQPAQDKKEPRKQQKFSGYNENEFPTMG